MTLRCSAAPSMPKPGPPRDTPSKSAEICTASWAHWPAIECLHWFTVFFCGSRACSSDAKGPRASVRPTAEQLAEVESAHEGIAEALIRGDHNEAAQLLREHLASPRLSTGH